MPTSPVRDPRTAGPKPPFGRQEQPSPGSEQELSPKPDHGEKDYVGHQRLAGQVALVTGADSGIGRAVALAFAREGADVVLSYLEETEDARECSRDVRAAGKKAILAPGDLSREQGCIDLVQRTLDAYGRVDCLVNNAAYQGKSVDDFSKLTADRVEHTFKTNIVSMFNLTRLCLPHMQAGATIINVASIQAYKPNPGILDYASTKGAIVAFTKGLSQELLPKHGIRVNCVAPGPVWTPLIAQSFPAEKVDQFGAKSGMGRPAQPKELAPAFVFLACDESRFVNGEILGVTGGGLLA